MNNNRKHAAAREKDLRVAILRVKHGRSHTGATQVSIASVAREAGVSPALIHNHYPAIADAIRLEQGRDSRAQRNAKQQEPKQEREKVRELRRELVELRADVARLASINEVLLSEREILQIRLGEKVVQLRPSKPNRINPSAGSPTKNGEPVGGTT